MLFDKSNTFYINLDQDTEKRNKMERVFGQENIEISRFSAIYGNNLDKNTINKYFSKKCSKYCLKSIIGCAISHIKLWEKMVKENNDFFLIFEDDVLLTKNFKEHLYNKIKYVPNDWDIIYLGSVVCTDALNKTNNNDSIITTIVESECYILSPFYNSKLINKHIRKTNITLGAYSYIISNKFAKKFLNYIYKEKLKTHIDISLVLYGINIKSNYYELIPYIVRTRATALESNNTSKRPYFLNKILDIFYGDKQKTIAWTLSGSIYQIKNYYINKYIFFYIIINLIARSFGLSFIPLILSFLIILDFLYIKKDFLENTLYILMDLFLIIGSYNLPSIKTILKTIPPYLL